MATSREVFYPTSTINLLLASLRKFVNADLQKIGTALDLGCGCGIVAAVLAKLVFPQAKVCCAVGRNEV